MKNKGIYIIIILSLVSIAVFIIAFALRPSPILDKQNPNGTSDMLILNKLKLTYSDKWAVTNNGLEGIELLNGETNILITTLETDGTKTLDDIVNERNDQIKATKKIISDDVVKYNNIELRRLEYGSLNEENFPTDGLIAYSTLIDKVYLTLIINYPLNGNPADGETIIKTLRYN